MDKVQNVLGFWPFEIWDSIETTELGMEKCNVRVVIRPSNFSQFFDGDDCNKISMG